LILDYTLHLLEDILEYHVYALKSLYFDLIDQIVKLLYSCQTHHALVVLVRMGNNDSEQSTEDVCIVQAESKMLKAKILLLFVPLQYIFVYSYPA
jgi:hypothetical protein